MSKTTYNSLHTVLNKTLRLPVKSHMTICNQSTFSALCSYSTIKNYDIGPLEKSSKTSVQIVLITLYDTIRDFVMQVAIFWCNLRFRDASCDFVWRLSTFRHLFRSFRPLFWPFSRRRRGSRRSCRWTWTPEWSRSCSPRPRRSHPHLKFEAFRWSIPDWP